MRYPLINRFKGTLLGALLGQVLAQDAQNYLSCDVSEILLLGTKNLIELGKLDLDNWPDQHPTEPPDLNCTDSLLLRAIIATLPVALFFHDHSTHLRQNLLEMLPIWGGEPVVRDGTLAVGYTIAKSLTEKLDPQTLIPEIISFIGDTSTLLPDKLIKLNNLSEQAVGLETVQAEFSREDDAIHAIVMAFYCFLSTLEDLQLAVLRATHKDNTREGETGNLHLQTISIITGALSGAYNSTLGIPVKWHGLLSPDNSRSPVVELADVLVAVWSGVYDPAVHFNEYPGEGCVRHEEQTALCVFASPRVIQSR
ncbi:ADP-ribosylglycohydrolase family protein [Anabaenopsis tanganyikae CS-531]|uniref:ADP-ribosylglycohydrolase family protein n=2 Tax=Anabaenopsis TaxID=110103 RepID=A0ABT5ARY9_9CYAN|nr:MULTISPECIES: ADP-ribosylglycohydrolase family protein [Anabaenopsis]MDB9540087.1 ADP-ribosylglycohydrolase family protein [Anabaenopsis arnoldii]MDH6092447.1 ADP-ribosylglycohydrolase family protein [Anabaenopsis arnoldii]MDH6106697.1 ADP-ribosylglycohydrolase family protein [Anabaenopsis tanganyikae CS-531]